MLCGAIRAGAGVDFPDRLVDDPSRARPRCSRECRPECVAIENLFHAANVRSALKLGHARGVAMLAAVEAGVPVVEYTPAEIKRAVVGYGRAEKRQVQQMVELLLGLDARRRLRTTPPMPWRWRSAMCINGAGAAPRRRRRALRPR